MDALKYKSLNRDGVAAIQKLVSIVLPVYNGERYLAQAIESVLNQTYQNIELFLVNDCSTDSSESIMLSYQKQDRRVVYIKNKVNSKLPASLNNGFARARGEYYTWTSDDNLYHPDAIEKMVDYLEAHPDVGMVACDYNEIDEDGQFTTTTRVGDADMLIFQNVIGACFLYRETVAKTIGEYRTDLFLIEDYDYWIRISEHFYIAFLHEILYEYRRHTDSLSLTRMNEVRRVLGEYRWANLSKYEDEAMPDEKLFDFFDLILAYHSEKNDVFRLKLGFARRHPTYYVRMTRQYANVIHCKWKQRRKRRRIRRREIARKLLGDRCYETLKAMKYRLRCK